MGLKGVESTGQITTQWAYIRRQLRQTFCVPWPLVLNSGRSTSWCSGTCTVEAAAAWGLASTCALCLMGAGVYTRTCGAGAVSWSEARCEVLDALGRLQNRSITPTSAVPSAATTFHTTAATPWEGLGASVRACACGCA